MSKPLTFFEHARQSYGALPIDADYQWIVSGRDAEGKGDAGEFGITLTIHRPHEPWAHDSAHVTIQSYPDCAVAMAKFVAAGGHEALANVAGPDDVTAALLGCGFVDRSDFAARVVSCPCCIGMGKIRAEDRAAVESALKAKS